MNNRQGFEKVAEQVAEQLVKAIRMDNQDQVQQALYQAKQSLEVLFTGYLDFEYEGIQESGFWSKAWVLWSKYHEDLDDCYQQVVVEAVELATTKPEILRRGAGYLLQAATWKAMNQMRSLQHTYIVNARSISVESLDVEDHVGNPKVEQQSTPMVDVEMKVAVRQVVAKLDPTDARIARLLMDGYEKHEVADILGVSRAAVSYRLRKLRVALEQENVEQEPEITSPEPATPVSLRKAWWN